MKKCNECGTEYISALKECPECTFDEFTIVENKTFDEISEELRMKFIDAATESIGSETYVCSRCWVAWQIGTMTENDFHPAGEDDDTIYNIACKFYELYLKLREE